MVDAFSYIRMSRSEQARGDSRRRQTEAAERFALDNKLNLIERLSDIGVPAYKGQNLEPEAALGRFLNLVKEPNSKIKPGSYLIVENLDRLSRQKVATALRLFLDLMDHGITIVTLSDGQIYSSSILDGDFTKILISIIYMARAHDESVTKSGRISSAWSKKRSSVREDKSAPRMSLRVPAWVNLSPDRRSFSLNSRADVVRRIYAHSEAGLGTMAIAQRLNRDAIPTFNDSKRGWQKSSVQKVLTTETVLGAYQPHRLIDGRRVPEGAPITDYYPRVISDEQFLRVRAAMQQRMISGAGQKSGFINLFSGMLYCAQCGGPIHQVNKGNSPRGGGRLLCCDSARRDAGCQNRSNAKYFDVERAVITMLTPEEIRSVQKFEQMELNNQRESLVICDQKIASTERKINWLVSLHEQTDENESDEDDPLVVRIREHRSLLKEFKKEAAALRSKLTASEQRLSSIDDDEIEREREALLARIDFEAPETPEIQTARATFSQQIRMFVDRITIGPAWVAGSARPTIACAVKMKIQSTDFDPVRVAFIDPADRRRAKQSVKRVVTADE